MLFFHISKASSITIKPILSQRSNNSGAGGLCEVRIPFTPISFKISNWRSIALVLIAEPSGPKSWCIQTPLILTCFPFKIKPFSRSNLKFLIPKEVLYSSIIVLSILIVVTAVYCSGFSTDHKTGFFTIIS